MHLHYITLLRQVEFLRPKITGTVIADSYSQNKNEWVIALPGGGLQLSCDAQFPFILWTEQRHRAKNSTEVLDSLIGLQINDIALMPGERIIKITFAESPHTLIIKLFTAGSNFFIVDESGTIVNSFKNARKFTGEPFAVPPSDQLDPEAIERDEFHELLNRQRKDSFPQILRRFSYLTRPVIRELLFRCEIPEKLITGDATEEQLLALWVNLENLLKNCRTDAPRVYFDGEFPERFTLTEFRSLGTSEQRTFESVNDGLRFFIFRRQKLGTLQQSRKQLTDALSRKLNSLKFNLSQLEAKPPDESQIKKNQQIGELIVAQPQLLKPGVSEISVINYFDENMPEITVSVDPELSAQDNAEKYFRKARQFSENAKEREERWEQLQRQHEELEALASQLQQSDDLKIFRQVQERLKTMHILQHHSQDSDTYRLPYKTYFFKDVEIWVGKSSADNDTLTFKCANKEDFWLHVQGYAGSHVVIRNPRRSEQPPQHALEYAARLAATNSKAKHASYVPVVYTKVKFVRKPRKSPPGTVIPSQVKSIFVDPL